MKTEKPERDAAIAIREQIERVPVSEYPASYVDPGIAITESAGTDGAFIVEMADGKRYRVRVTND